MSKINKVLVLDKLKEAKELLDIDAITEDEFNEIKNKYLKQLHQTPEEPKIPEMTEIYEKAEKKVKQKHPPIQNQQYIPPSLRRVLEWKSPYEKEKSTSRDITPENVFDFVSWKPEDNFDEERDKEALDIAKKYLFEEIDTEKLSNHIMASHHKFRELWEKIPDKPKIGSEEYHKLIKKTFNKSDKWVLVEHNFYREFKKLCELFREANCKFSLDNMD